VTLRMLMTWALGAAVLAFTPSAPEILSKMTATLRKAEAVEARAVREKPEGQVLEELLLVFPAKPGSREKLQAVLDLPYTLMGLPAEELTESLPTVASQDASVTLGRLDGKVCYIIEGRDERLWITKGEFMPLKIEVFTDKRLGTLYLYLDMVQLSEKVWYPSRTEVWRGSELVLVERLLPATASTDIP